ncbi:MAG TPA: hypothetical protein VMY37_18360 [Thermoguttaceae bacterium]|nr:hypothetical protein [Thermoguttaceae bacterium]
MNSADELPVERAGTPKDRARGPRRFKHFALYVTAACILILYVATYLVMSRVTAATKEARTWDGPKMIFVFFGEEIETEDGGRMAILRPGWFIPEAICYHFFWPMAKLDACFGLRYHAMRTHWHDDGTYEVW